ncbi:MAG: Peptidylarginine deiminase-like protein enzyme, partial [candidate division WWE3 bacterium GW2011_GWC2_44_9]
MISETETNYVWFSGLLPKRFPGFFHDITRALEACGIEFGLLPHTKDIWCRDYMPVRVGRGKFVQFTYDPAYLVTKADRATITDPAKACKAIGIKPVISDIVLDGGNVVRHGSKVIMTRVVLASLDNAGYSREWLNAALKNLLKVDEVIFIQPERGDPFCHADGSVRFISDKLVAIDKPHKLHPEYGASLRSVLKQHGLSWIELPYSLDDDPRHKYSAVGNYVNFLAIGKTVFVPAYKGHEAQNREAVRKLSKWFREVVPIES